MSVLEAVRESRIFRPVFPASGSLPARGRFLMTKRPRYISFLALKSTLDPGFGIRYERDALLINRKGHGPLHG